MDRQRLLPIPLPPGNSLHNGNTKGKVSFMKRFAVGFVILACLVLLYVPAYHLVQGPYSGFGETSFPVVTLGSKYFKTSIVQLKGWSSNTSRDLDVYINPENETAILNPKHICNDTLYLLIIVCSAVSNFNARNSIRSSWGNSSYLKNFYNSSVKVTFLLGQSNNETINNHVIKENQINNDIIVEKFYDTYNNLTLKSVMLLKWVTRECIKLTYLMKSDDDMFVNIPALLKSLKERPKTENILMGSLICNARPIKDPKNKWYMPKYMFSKKTYPNYLSGTGYVMSFDVAHKLYKTALTIPLIYLEDVFITGVCASHAKIRPINNAGFSFLPRKLDSCSLQNSITAHKITSSMMQTIWKKLNNSNNTCKNSKSKKNSIVQNISRLGRHVGYFVIKNRAVNKCI